MSKDSSIYAKTFSAGSPEAARAKVGKPNVPDFSWDPETGAPVLLPGETIVHEGQHNGLPIVLTNHARRIYLCSLDEYEDKVGIVSDRELYLHFYPQAAGPLPAAKAPEKAVQQVAKKGK